MPKRDNVGVDSRAVGFCTPVGRAEADNAVLKPAVTLFTDQRSTGVAVARVFIALHGSGAYHIKCQMFHVEVTKIMTFVPVDDRYSNLLQDAGQRDVSRVVSRLYVHEHLTLLQQVTR